MILPYFPPTTKEEASKKLDVSLKYVENLIKDGVLKSNGILVNNFSIENFIKGGKGYVNQLSMELNHLLDNHLEYRLKMSKEKSKVMNFLNRLSNDGFIDVSFKSEETTSLANLSMIEKVKWNKKAKFFMNKLLDEIIEKDLSLFAYEYGINYVEVDTKSDLEIHIKNIKENGFSGLFTEVLNERIEQEKVQLKEYLSDFEKLSKSQKDMVLEIKSIKREIVSSHFKIYDENTKEKYSKKIEHLENGLEQIKNKSVCDFEFYERWIYKLNLENEIQLLEGLKPRIWNNNRNHFHDFVNHFNSMDFRFDNHILSMELIRGRVNHIRELYKLDKFDNDSEILNELKEKLAWEHSLIEIKLYKLSTLNEQ